MTPRGRMIMIERIAAGRPVAVAVEMGISRSNPGAQGSHRFALIAGLAGRCYRSRSSALGATAGTATDPITSRETPTQHARTSFRHPHV
jgi:hypothetical protein